MVFNCHQARFPLFVCGALVAGQLLSVSIVVQPLVDPDVLEPSIRNEVEHALARIPTTPAFQPARDALPFPTNGLSNTEIAIKLVALQREDGRWRVGTNDVTAAVSKVLENL